MIKLIEKRVPKTTYIIELDLEEMKEIWSIAVTAAYSCEQTLGNRGCNPDNMKERIKLLRYIEKSFHDYIFN